MIRIQWPSDAMRPQTNMLDAVASRGTLTPLLGSTCGLRQVTCVSIKGLALQKVGMLGARLALHISSAQNRALVIEHVSHFGLGLPNFIPKSVAAANRNSKSKLICGPHCAPTLSRHDLPLVFQVRQAQPSDSPPVLHNQLIGRARRGPLTLWVIGRARRGPLYATPPPNFLLGFPRAPEDHILRDS